MNVRETNRRQIWEIRDNYGPTIRRSSAEVSAMAPQPILSGIGVIDHILDRLRVLVDVLGIYGVLRVLNEPRVIARLGLRDRSQIIFEITFEVGGCETKGVDWSVYDSRVVSSVKVDGWNRSWKRRPRRPRNEIRRDDLVLIETDQNDFDRDRH